MNTILFDLDGTLLPMDMKLFEKIYFQELCGYFQDIIASEKLIKLIWQSTGVMINNAEFRTNEEVFFEDFNKKVGGDSSIFLERFDTFYDTAFQKVKASVKNVPSIKESIQILKEKGYNLVIATNPLFPRKAIYHRIEWAGFNPSEFSYISTFETNHYCKPHLNYYREILTDISESPENCLMVGNDVQEDLIASKIGIKTFLIKDNILHRTNEEIICDYSGSYEDFLNFSEDLPKVN